MRQHALMRVLKESTHLSAQTTVYTLALGAIALSGMEMSTLPAVLSNLLIPVGVNSLSTLLDRVARGESDEVEIRAWVSKSIEESRIGEALTEQKFQIEMGRLLREHQHLRYIAQHTEESIITALRQELVQYPPLLLGLREGIEDLKTTQTVILQQNTELLSGNLEMLDILRTFQQYFQPSTYDLRELSVFISSPADVANERRIVAEVLERLNQMPGISGKIRLKPLAYEREVPPIVGSDPQPIVDRYMIEAQNADIFICMMWSRMGTEFVDPDTGERYLSGTQYEFINAYHSHRQRQRPIILLYRGTQPYPSNTDPMQLAHVETFFQSFHGENATYRGLYKPYNSLDAFEEQLVSDLQQVLEKDFLNVSPAQKPYLSWLIDKHRTLELRNFRYAGHYPSIPLNQVYVALRGQRTSNYELASSHALLEVELNDYEEMLSHGNLSREEKRALTWQHLGRSPYMPSLDKLYRPELSQEGQTERLTLAEVFRRERCVVLLGDPGSGKTTLARWLVLQLANAMLAADQRVQVSSHHVDPANDADTSEDLGEARLPIIVRIAEFADARRNQPELLLVDFLGTTSHTWQKEVPKYNASDGELRGQAIPSDELKRMFRQVLLERRTVVILDGLDEIGTTDDRLEVVRAIQTFIDDYIISPETRRGILGTEPPVTSGGNQIIITSRIAGYHAAPLIGGIAHFTIEPMSDIAINRFCTSWMLAVNQLDFGETPAAEQHASEETEALKAEIHNPERPGVRELAMNPLLLTMLATLYRENQARLPEQRVSLYKEAVELLAHVWRSRIGNLTDHEVMYILMKVAEHIHGSHASGLIERTELANVMEMALAAIRPNANRIMLRSDVDIFLETLTEDVGLIAARAQYLYGFLHLTFQEYLSARALIDDRQKAAENLISKLGNPRWREPLLLALGAVSVEWDARERERLYLELLQAPSGLNELLPRSAILLASAIPEMVNLPSELIITQVTTRLLETAADREGIGRFQSLQATIEAAIANLSHPRTRSIFERIFIDIMRRASTTPKQALAAAHFAEVLKFDSLLIGESLLYMLTNDNVSWNFPVDRALRDFAARGISLGRLTFKSDLARKPAWVKVITEDIRWLRMVVALYGGLVPAKQQQENQNVPFEFSPEAIHRDSPLTELLRNALQSENPAKTLKQALEKVWQTGTRPEDRIEAGLALTAFGESMVERLRQESEGVVRPLLERMILVEQYLGPATGASSKLVNNQLQHWAIVDPIEYGDMLSGLQQFLITYNRQAGNPITLLTPQPQFRAQVITEVWAHTFSAENDDPMYSMAVTLDTMGGKLASDPMVLALSLAYLHQKPRRGYHGWKPESFPPPITSKSDVVAEAINTISRISFGYDNLRSWALEELAPLLKQHPGHTLEAAAIAHSIFNEELRKRAIAAIAPDLLEVDDILVEIETRTHMLTDPLSQSRVLWRLIPFLPAERAAINYTMLKNSARMVDDPGERSRMLWRAIRILVFSRTESDLGHYVDLLRDAYLVTDDISDPDERARARARLAGHIRPPNEILSEVLDDIAQITDERARALMLDRIRPYLMFSPQLLNRSDALSLQIKDSMQRALAQGNFAPRLFKYIADDAEPNVWGPITLLALFDDLRAQIDVPKEQDEIWLALNDTRRRSRCIETLNRLSLDRLLPLSPTAATAINSLLLEGHYNTAVQLLHCVRSDSEFTQPLLRDWIQHEDERVRHCAALLLAEMEVFSPNILDELVIILKGDHDRLRHRAALALYDRNVYRWLYISQMPPNTLETAIRISQENPEHALVRQVTGAWFWEALVFDDDRAIENWLYAANSGDKIAIRILSRIHHLNIYGWHGFLKALNAEVDPRLTCILLRSLIYILNSEFRRLPEALIQAVRKELHRYIQGGGEEARWSIEALGYFRKLSDKDVTLLRNIIDGEDPILATEAVIALGRFHYREHEAAIAALRLDPRSQVQTAGDVALIMYHNTLIRPAESQVANQVQTALEQIIEAIGPDTDRLYRACVLAGCYRWYGDDAKAFYQLSGALVERFPDLLLQAYVDLREASEDQYRLHNDSFYDFYEAILSDMNWMRPMALFDMLASAASRMPSAFLKDIDPFEMELFLHDHSSQAITFTQRMNVLTCLSYVRRVTPDAVDIIRMAMHDVSYVQEAAVKATLRFRKIESGFLNELAKGIYESSPAVAFATLRVLTAVGMAEHTLTEDRIAIIDYLATALQRSEGRREVYLLEDHIEQVTAENGDTYTVSKGLTIRYYGRLDELIYQSLVQIAGIGDPQHLRRFNFSSNRGLERYT